VPPEGPQWSAFSIRIAEKDYYRVPEVLLAQEEKAPGMGLAARAAWVQWFSEEVCFHRVVEWCLDIKRSRTVPESLMRLSAASQLLRPFHFVHYLRTRYKFFQQEGRLVL
ncbi:MAG: hypothetical protein H7Y22_07700, partial [Gemmatimonadaceae bacterium]|nr:hypothetical protein [Gloeobacterales cyanobacterium ES-bin-141]